MHNYLEQLSKRLIFKYTTYGAPLYPYNITPGQLSRIVHEIDRLADVEGNIAEIGVARGMTTRFLCEHIKNLVHHRGTYYAIDTFESFTEQDLDWEIEKRGKRREELKGFAYNDFETWAKNFNSFPFVKPIKADCASVDYSKIGPLKLVFLDVDLYLPTIKTLRRVYKNLSNEGIILIDDVTNNNRWDGAYQAYMEFCREINLEPEVFNDKCGVIKKLDYNSEK